MPSRFSVVAILAFWLSTTGYLGYTRLLPWLLASGTPSVSVSATDEASRQKVRWIITFNKQRAGTLTSELKSDDDNTYTFLAKYSDLLFEIGPFPVKVPTATTQVTVDREGFLRRQAVHGTAEFMPSKVKFLADALGGTVRATAEVQSQVVNGELRGRVQGSIAGINLDAMDLPAVPVPTGQVLNPLMPVNRLSGVEPGQSWRIRQVDPLGDSLKQLLVAMAKKNGFGAALPLGGEGGEELLAEVQSATENIPLRRGEEEVICRVIVYRGTDNKVVARTWVHASDGRVMRQEATAGGNTLRLDRDE